jgi:hypothetical protein
MGRTNLALRLTETPPRDRPGGLAHYLKLARQRRAIRSVCSVTLVTKWLRSVDLSIRLVTLGDFSKGQENHHVGRGT